MKVVLIAMLSIGLMCGVAFGDAANMATYESDHAIQTHAPDSKIPNLTTTAEDSNGRPQKLDKRGNKDGTKLNSVERQIIIRDAVRSNAQSVIAD